VVISASASATAPVSSKSWMLEQLLNSETGHRGTTLACGAGHEAEFVGYRDKHLTTVLGPLGLRRAYYHCASCGTGLSPKDQELDIVATSFSPGARRLMARVGRSKPSPPRRRIWRNSPD
jgi:hypothetical protein